ncbi:MULTISPECIES: FAD-binding oxidoreductase [Pelosinus]|uniref:FAD linked oxidase domain protein n=1 Tax=Pelosinus fermentans B4 TaxID=1149862 RepID=I9LFY7_9FIRM|nr:MULTISPECIES: FAD-linked oxidase C-terminal domain-containing protein [Pelosinus]EIW19389.1 FAD linked oxidase domain protein [Pelosinus fermentans B4]EIW24880.1 FAD linked oxidase domain protein [Pelosinus fermentans A11]OAM96381.1 D-lactate dehydrogenase (cytochrome) [Pelosinus fermentans DSM 17108]SDR39533.1 glycolate oxidase [Pelosinus fermentans]
MIANEIKRKIRNIVGLENAIDSTEECFGYSYDSSFVPMSPENIPDLVVIPSTTEEISAVMAIANEYGIPVTPRGTASGRTGGSIPVCGGISLALHRMTKIIEFDEGNMMITVEAGVRTIDVYNFCAERGLFFPPDPASWKYATIGGNVGENAGGMRAVKYGVTSNYVMGLEVVLADGSIINTGGKAIKNVTGYNLTQLFTGSEGTLCVITKVLLRLIPMPKARNTLQLMFPSLDNACKTIHKMLISGVVPAAAELMDKISIQAVARHRKLEIDSSIEACVILEIDGETNADLEKQAKQIQAIANEFRVLEVRIAASQQEVDDIWSIRRGLSSAIGAMAPNRFGEDISVPRNAFPETVGLIRKIAEKYNLTIAVYGHAGDGNIHPSVLCDLSKPGEEQRVHDAVNEIFSAALSVGGTLSGEHGIGITKRPHITKALGEAGVNALQMVKQSFDPKGILNPNKIW